MPTDREYLKRKAVDGKFQNDGDVENENAAIRDLVRQWPHLDVRKYPPLSSVDWLIRKRGAPHAVAEFKQRSHVYGKYPTIFMSRRKIVALQQEARRLKINAHFFARFADGELRFWDVNDPRIAALPWVTIGGFAKRDINLKSQREPGKEVEIAWSTVVPVTAAPVR
jgi:hypothetical protein